MSVRKLTASLLTALAMLAGGTSVHAQEYLPPADPHAFDPDFRWFEPVHDMDLADMKAKYRANTGWFGTYDRLKLYASRPETNNPRASETQLDSGDGDRYEVGYMLPSENGWMFTYTDMDVDQYDTLRHERLNRYSEAELTGEGFIDFFDLPVPISDANNIGYNFRFYDIQEAQNVFTYDSYELNKTWRMEPYHYGGILEPMVGIRWMDVEDLNLFQDYLTTFDESPLQGRFAAAERLTTVSARTENDLIGPQVGFRYFKFRDRFTFATDFRVFAGGSFQSSRSQTSSETTVYNYEENVVEIGQAPLAVDRTESPLIHTRNEEAFVGFDLRGEIGYQLTKAITIRGGFQLIDIGTGLWRGGAGTNQLAGDRDQDLQMLGGTFGVTLNR